MFRSSSVARGRTAAAAAAAVAVAGCGLAAAAIASDRLPQQQQRTPRVAAASAAVDSTVLLSGLKAALPRAPAARVALAAGVDYASVRKDLVAVLDKTPRDYDDGSYGPLFVRLAWHASGTYDVKTKTGGSEGATMRFPPESTDGANAGLQLARELLEPIKEKYPELSYADLWTLAGSVAIEECGGPSIKWRPGRKDAGRDAKVVENGRLPDASKGAQHIRDVFYRQGFNDREIVALIGAHALGRCHTSRSGFDGPWTKSPTMMSNEFFQQLLDREWVEKKWTGPRQFVNKDDRTLMMLPTDLALLEDPEFRKVVVEYAKDEAKFFSDFAAAWLKLIENGVPAFEKKGWFGLW